MGPEVELERIFTGVYGIRNCVNGKLYIGSTAKSFKERWNQHLVQLRGNRHYNKHIQAAWNKHGEYYFVFFVLERCQPDQAVVREQFWIDVFDSADRSMGYNGRPKAESNLGKKFGPMSEEHKDKIRKACNGNRRGAKLSLETRALISAAQKGKPKPVIRKSLAGRKQTDAHKASIKAGQLARFARLKAEASHGS